MSTPFFCFLAPSARVTRTFPSRARPYSIFIALPPMPPSNPLVEQSSKRDCSMVRRYSCALAGSAKRSVRVEVPER